MITPTIDILNIDIFLQIVDEVVRQGRVVDEDTGVVVSHVDLFDPRLVAHGQRVGELGRYVGVAVPVLTPALNHVRGRFDHARGLQAARHQLRFNRARCQ